MNYKPLQNTLSCFLVDVFCTSNTALILHISEFCACRLTMFSVPRHLDYKNGSVISLSAKEADEKSGISTGRRDAYKQKIWRSKRRQTANPGDTAGYSRRRYCAPRISGRRRSPRSVRIVCRPCCACRIFCLSVSRQPCYGSTPRRVRRRGKTCWQGGVPRLTTLTAQ